MNRLTKSDVLSMMQEHGAIVNGHFELASGLHSPTYVELAVVLQYPFMAAKLAKALAAKFPVEVDVVVSPALGGVIVGQEVARTKKCRAIFAERSGASLGLRRDFKLERGERVLVVEDVLNTGHSTSEIVSLCGVYGAKVVGIAAIVDRSSSPLPLRVPARSLATYPVRVYPPETCPLCARSVPLTQPRPRASSRTGPE